MEMHELVKSLEALDQKLVAIKSMLRLVEKEKEITVLEAEVNASGFWSDQKKAVEKSQKLGWLKEEKEHWGKLAKEIKDLLEMAQLDEADKEVNLREEIEKQYLSLNKQVGELEFGTLMSEKYDSQNAIVAIHSGSGGTEAMQRGAAGQMGRGGGEDIAPVEGLAHRHQPVALPGEGHGCPAWRPEGEGQEAVVGADEAMRPGLDPERSPRTPDPGIHDGQVDSSHGEEGSRRLEGELGAEDVLGGDLMGQIHQARLGADG